MIAWTKNRRAAVAWLLKKSKPMTIAEAEQAVRDGELGIKLTSVNRTFVDGVKPGVFGKAGSAYYPLINPETGNPVALRLVEVNT